MSLTASILSLIRNFKDPIIESAKYSMRELDHIFNDRLSSYLHNMIIKFEKTKTFLHRDSLVEFDKTYYPVTLLKKIIIQDGFEVSSYKISEDEKNTRGGIWRRLLRVKNVEEKTEDSVEDVVEFKIRDEEYKFVSLESFYRNNNFTTIIGRAGSGKSMLMKKIFLKCIEQKIKIPIYLELRALNSYDGGLAEYIESEILGLKLVGSEQILKKILKRGDFLFLFDGYDEIYSDKKNAITLSIERFIDHNSKNWFVITSREGAGIESLNRFENNYILPLIKKEVEEFVKLQCNLIGDKKLAINIIKEINEPHNIDVTGYLENPLLLSMFLLFYRSNISLPEIKYDFYNNVYNTILTKHYAFTRVGGWQHKRDSGLTNKQVTEVLCWLSYRTYFLGLIEFSKEELEKQLSKIVEQLEIECSIEDLIQDLYKNINIIILEGNSFRFPHRSLQEYFTVRQINRLDDSTKDKVYNDQLMPHLKMSTDSGYNLLDLLLESDPEGLYSKFILPSLQRIQLKYEKLSSVDRIKKLVEEYIVRVDVRVDYSIDDIRVVKYYQENVKVEKVFEYMTGYNYLDTIVNQIIYPLEHSNRKLVISNYFRPRKNTGDFKSTAELIILRKDDLISLIDLIKEEIELPPNKDIVHLNRARIEIVESKLNKLRGNQFSLIDLT